MVTRWNWMELVSIAGVLFAGAVHSQESKPPAGDANKSDPPLAADEFRLPLRFDRDANNDGILDSVASHVMGKPPTTFSLVHQTMETAKPKPKPPVKARSTRGNDCMSYLLLDSKSRAKVDRRVNGITGGAFGTRPCDPVVSPELPRPFDDDYIDIPILPIRIAVP